MNVQNASIRDSPYIEKALTLTSLMDHSLASPSSVANVMYQKYVNGMLLYRQGKDWEQLDITLKRATMATGSSDVPMSTFSNR